MSFVSLNLSVLLEMRKLNTEKRNFLLLSCKSGVILAFCELYFNLLKISTPKNLEDGATLSLIKRNFRKLGILISPSNSIKLKRKILIEDRNLQNLALFQCLGGYIYYNNSTKNSQQDTVGSPDIISTNIDTGPHNDHKVASENERGHQ